MKSKLLAIVAVAAAPFVQAGDQDVYITEFSYKGLFGEYVEVTNTGEDDVDLNGWIFDDNHRLAEEDDGVVLFTSSTVLGQNESIIVTEVSAAVFTQAWYVDSLEGTPASLVAIFQNNSVNLGRSDEVNIYSDDVDGNGDPVLVDRITFNDEGTGTVDGPRTEDVSAVPGAGALGTNVFSSWAESEVGTGNAWKAGAPAAPGPVGSPGVYPN